jgi:hypothetical protein
LKITIRVQARERISTADRFSALANELINKGQVIRLMSLSLHLHETFKLRLPVFFILLQSGSVFITAHEAHRQV